jgi:hypothetical protein
MAEERHFRQGLIAGNGAGDDDFLARHNHIQLPFYTAARNGPPLRWWGAGVASAHAN